MVYFPCWCLKCSCWFILCIDLKKFNSCCTIGCTVYICNNIPFQLTMNPLTCGLLSCPHCIAFALRMQVIWYLPKCGKLVRWLKRYKPYRTRFDVSHSISPLLLRAVAIPCAPPSCFPPKTTCMYLEGFFYIFTQGDGGEPVRYHCRYHDSGGGFSHPTQAKMGKARGEGGSLRYRARTMLCLGRGRATACVSVCVPALWCARVHGTAAHGDKVRAPGRTFTPQKIASGRVRVGRFRALGVRWKVV